MTPRLEYLHLLPPPARGIWAGNRLHSVATTIRRGDEVEVPIELPLFWYEPSWIRLSPELADQLAIAVSNLDVVVSALRRDLGGSQRTVQFTEARDNDGQDGSSVYLPRMVPYRIERYGLSPTDFDNATIIDVRVSASRDLSGRLAYAPEQMERWEQPSDDSPIAGGGYVAAGTFPADVVSLKQLSNKLDQLRLLSPSAAVFVSIGPYRLEEEISAALIARPDGLIVRFDEVDAQGKYLANAVCQAKKVMQESRCGDLPLWIVPGPITPDDAVKLIALGASAVAIDSWCQPILDAVIEAAPASRYRSQTAVDVSTIVSENLWDDLDRVVGLLSSLPPGLKPEQYLGSFHPTWAKMCRVTQLR